MSWAQSCEELLPFAQDRLWARLKSRGTYWVSRDRPQFRGAEYPGPHSSFVAQDRTDFPRKQLVASSGFIAGIRDSRLWVVDRSDHTLHWLAAQTASPKGKHQAIAIHGEDLWLLSITSSAELPAAQRPANWKASRHARELSRVQQWRLRSGQPPALVASSYLPGQSFRLRADAQGAHLALQHDLGEIDEILAKESVAGLDPSQWPSAVTQSIDLNRKQIEALPASSLAPRFLQIQSGEAPKEAALLDCSSIARLGPGRSRILLSLSVPPAHHGQPFADFGLAQLDAFLRLPSGWVVSPHRPLVLGGTPARLYIISSRDKVSEIDLGKNALPPVRLALRGQDLFVMDRYQGSGPDQMMQEHRRLIWLRAKDHTLEQQQEVELDIATSYYTPWVTRAGLLFTNDSSFATSHARVVFSELGQLRLLAPLKLESERGWSYRPLGADSILGTVLEPGLGGSKRLLSVRRWTDPSQGDLAQRVELPNRAGMLSQVDLSNARVHRGSDQLFLPYSFVRSGTAQADHGMWRLAIREDGTLQGLEDTPLGTLPISGPKEKPPRVELLDLGEEILVLREDRLYWIQAQSGKELRMLELGP